MKKLFHLFAQMLFAFYAFAQAPQGINYQALARNAAGNILGNQNICVQSTITNGNGGAVLYQETFNVTTNQFGLFTLNIGNGTVVSGTFATINWGAVTPWQKMEIKIGCAGAYVLMGSAQLLSVPYALNAATTADNKWTQTGNDISNTNTGNVGIGIATPPANLKLNVAGRVAPDWGTVNDATYRFGDGTENSGFSSPNPNEITVISNGNESVRVTGNGNIGIGTSTPQAKLDVNGSVRINDGSQGAGKVLTSDGFGTGSWQVPSAQQVYFLASRWYTDFTFNNGNVHLLLDSLWENDGNAYNLSTGIFTAPTDGLYFFHAQVEWLTAFSGAYLQIRKNDNFIGCSSSYLPTVNLNDQQNVTGVFKMTAGETIDFKVGANANVTIQGIFRNQTFVTGYKIY